MPCPDLLFVGGIYSHTCTVGLWPATISVQKRLTRAEYDEGLGDSDDFDDASDDEAHIHNPADHALPSLVG